MVATKRISSLKKLFLRLLESLEPPILLEKVPVTPAYFAKISFFSSLSSFAKELSSNIIEFLCIVLLEVEISEVKDCRCCWAAFSLASISMS